MAQNLPSKHGALFPGFFAGRRLKSYDYFYDPIEVIICSA